jgi:hypothetical protein
MLPVLYHNFGFVTTGLGALRDCASACRIAVVGRASSGVSLPAGGGRGCKGRLAIGADFG